MRLCVRRAQILRHRRRSAIGRKCAETGNPCNVRRGWSEQEFQRLLADRNVVAHRATLGRTCAGFILSSLVAGEAEILSVAISPAYRGRGYARPLLDTHLRWLAGVGARAVFLEVGETNAPARRLYRRAGFREVGRRQGYYDSGVTALVLRRDLG